MYGVVLHAHPFRGESHNQRNTTGEVATVPYIVAAEPAMDLLIWNLFDQHLQRDSNARQQYSRLGRSILKVKGKPKT